MNYAKLAGIASATGDEHELSGDAIQRFGDLVENTINSRYVSIGVIDANGDIYPGPVEPGTQIFILTPNAELRGRPLADGTA